MTSRITHNASQEQGTVDALRNWTMVFLTLVFVLLYSAALVGWLKPLADEKMILRLEPTIFVIIGYYFGRLPGQENEKTLKGEISRQTQKTDAAQHANQQAQQYREALEEKLKNVRTVLASSAPSATAGNLAEHLDKTGGPVKEDALRHAVIAAIKILNS
jgi:hypothetical protein